MADRNDEYEGDLPEDNSQDTGTENIDTDIPEDQDDSTDSRDDQRGSLDGERLTRSLRGLASTIEHGATVLSATRKKKPSLMAFDTPSINPVPQSTVTQKPRSRIVIWILLPIFFAMGVTLGMALPDFQAQTPTPQKVTSPTTPKKTPVEYPETVTEKYFTVDHIETNLAGGQKVVNLDVLLRYDAVRDQKDLERNKVKLRAVLVEICHGTTPSQLNTQKGLKQFSDKIAVEFEKIVGHKIIEEVLITSILVK
jgi:flagellar basal body-associated protein FliL